MSSTTDKMNGKAKQALGKAMDDQELKTRGELQEAKGKVKEAANHAADKITDKL